MIMTQVSHLVHVNMSYIEHFSFSSQFGFIFLSAAVKAFIHSLFPEMYTTSTTDTVCSLYEKYGEHFHCPMQCSE